MDSNSCRQFAEDCLRMSQRALNAEHRAILIGMAESWGRMALEIEESAGAPERAKHPYIGSGG
jgi:hypothetical protein